MDQGRSVVRSFEDLEVWRLGMEVAEAVYAVSSGFPGSERFGLAAQIRRAAVSIPSNIAEGHARTSTRDFLRFLSIAAGSLAEVRTQLLLARRLGFIPQDTSTSLLARLDETGRTLRGLTRSLNAKLPPNP